MTCVIRDQYLRLNLKVFLQDVFLLFPLPLQLAWPRLLTVSKF